MTEARGAVNLPRSRPRSAQDSHKEIDLVSTEIYYFSGTGNSLHVAQELQKRLPGARLIPIMTFVERESVTASGDTVGFVFPHYASSLPKVVRAFIESLDLGSASYLFAIATRGGTKTWAFVEIDEILKEKGRRLDAHFAITMPGGNDALVKGYTERITEERIQRLESEMLTRLDAIHKIIVGQGASREEDKGDVAPPPFLEPFIPLLDAMSPYLIRVGRIVESSFEFYHDEKCTGCGVCRRVCLAGKVQMVASRPVWQDKVSCHGCFACLSFCPEQSIQIRSKWYLKSYTEQSGRYHHPQITAKEIAAQKTMAATQRQPVVPAIQD
jgi:NAD-dependent dihydropyrimidine dehydrogenase PreA subunit/flavodoxin